MRISRRRAVCENLGLFVGLMAALVLPAGAQSDPHLLAQKRWIEARTAHFQTYSCAPTQEVARLAARLEQFREAYSALAGAEAVASPPIVAMAYPDYASMRYFVALSQGKRANLEASFLLGIDE